MRYFFLGSEHLLHIIKAASKAAIESKQVPTELPDSHIDIMLALGFMVEVVDISTVEGFSEEVEAAGLDIKNTTKTKKEELN
jgi:hypothetical protein